VYKKGAVLTWKMHTAPRTFTPTYQEKIMASIAQNYTNHIRNQKQTERRARARAQRTFNAQYKDVYGIAREIDTYNLAFQADGSPDWRIVKRFDVELMLFGQVELAEAQAAADGAPVSWACRPR